MHVANDERIRIDGDRLDVVRGNADMRVKGAAITRLEGLERREVQGPSDAHYSDDVTVRVLGCATTIVGKADHKRSWTTRAQGTASLSAIDRLELSSDTEVVLSVGDSAIRITKNGIELSAASIVSKGEGGKCEVNKDGLSMKAKTTHLKLGDTIHLASPSSSMVVGTSLQLDGTQILMNSPLRATDEPPKPPPPPTTVELRDQDGNALPFQRYLITLDEGAQISGQTDKDGKAELELETGGKIVFPELAMPNEPAQGNLEPYVVR